MTETEKKLETHLKSYSTTTHKRPFLGIFKRKSVTEIEAWCGMKFDTDEHFAEYYCDVTCPVCESILCERIRYNNECMEAIV